MKKRSAVAVCAFLLLCTTGFAQNQFIFRAGYVSSKPEISPVFGTLTGKSGFYGALGYEASLNKLIAIQPEFVFIQKGDKRTGVIVSGQTRVNYFEVPLLLKLKVPAEKLLAYFNAGPAISFGLNGKPISTAFGTTINTDVQFGDGIDEFKMIDISAQLGGGLGYSIGKGAVLADVRYGLGLSNLSNANNSEYKSRALMIGLGFSLPL